MESAEHRLREECRRLEVRLRLLLLLLRLQRKATIPEATTLEHVLMLPHLVHVQSSPLSTCNMKMDSHGMQSKEDPFAAPSGGEQNAQGAPVRCG